MRYVKFILIFFLAFCIEATADSFDVSTIPDSLKVNANAVVRSFTTDFNYQTVNSATEKNSIAITVLNKKGESNLNFIYSGDSFRKLKNFSGKLYDANGKLLRKFKLSEVQSTEWSAHLADDARYYFFSPDVPSFPVTIHYEYEIEWRKGILVFPTFAPQRNFNLSVELATYKLTLPANVEFSMKSINTPEPVKSELNKGNTLCYEWKIENLKPIENEYLMPGLESYIPLLYLRPLNFIYDKTPGNITDWDSYGKWEYQLIKDRDALPDEFRNKIVEMTKNASSDREKVKILYDFMGQTTRYVSIQLGIGGYQPMLASEVYKNGFGDCKALSNYMKAMLNVVGIPSYYAGIRSDDSYKTLFHDYPNFNQMNHAILQVPLPNDTLWLECTNTRVPFGFVHNNISGHEALVISEEGGKICRLLDYPDSLNLESNKVIVNLKENGNAEVAVQNQAHLKIYDFANGIVFRKPNEQLDMLRRGVNLPNVTMGEFKINEDKTPLPILTVDYKFNTSLYGTKTANRIFLPVNPYRITFDWIKKQKRVHDIHRHFGYKDQDSIFISIPDGFDIESIPASISVESPYGDFNSTIVSVENGIVIQQMIYVRSGEFKLAEYTDYTSFFEKVNNGYKGKIILRKKN